MNPTLTIAALSLLSLTAAAQSAPPPLPSLPAPLPPSVAAFVSQEINVSDGDALALAAVCGTRYGIATRLAVVDPERAAEALQSNAGSVATAAQAVGATDVLDFHLVRLGQSSGDRILVHAVRTSASGPTRDASLELASLNDAPAACDRIARALITGESVDDARDRHNVTQAEVTATSNPARINSEHVAWAKVSLGSPVESGYQPIGSGRLGVNFESDRYFIETGAGFIMPSFQGSAQGYGGLVAELGASYYLNEGVNALFVGAGVEPRINFGGAVLEIAPYAQVGGMLWRDSKVRLFGEARIAQNLLPVTSSSSSVGTTLPTEVSLYVGIGM